MLCMMELELNLTYILFEYELCETLNKSIKNSKLATEVFAEFIGIKINSNALNSLELGVNLYNVVHKIIISQ